MKSEKLILIELGGVVFDFSVFISEIKNSCCFTCVKCDTLNGLEVKLHVDQIRVDAPRFNMAYGFLSKVD